LGGDEAIGSSEKSTGKIESKLPVVLDSSRGSGLEVRGRFCRGKGGELLWEAVLGNQSEAPMSGFMLQFNKNLYRLKPQDSVLREVGVLAAGASKHIRVRLNMQGEHDSSNPGQVQVALKNNISVFYFAMYCPVSVFFAEDGALEKNTYLETWRAVPDANESSTQVSLYSGRQDSAGVVAHLQAHNLFLIAQRNVNNNIVLYLSAKVTPPGAAVLVELTLLPGGQAKLCSRSAHRGLIPHFQTAVVQLLTQP